MSARYIMTTASCHRPVSIRHRSQESKAVRARVGWLKRPRLEALTVVPTSDSQINAKIPRTYLEFPAGEEPQLVFQLQQIQPPASGFSDGDDFPVAFSPREQVGVVLERSHEDYGAAIGAKTANKRHARKQKVLSLSRGALAARVKVAAES